MTDNADRERTELERANSNLKESLKRCHELVSELRDCLAANSNEPLAPDDPSPGIVRSEM